MVQTKWLCVSALVMVVTVQMVLASQPSTTTTTVKPFFHYHHKPVTCTHALMDLKLAWYACTGKFLCGVRNEGYSCEVQCIPLAKVCDRKRHCFNNADEEWWCRFLHRRRWRHRRRGNAEIGVQSEDDVLEEDSPEVTIGATQEQP